MADLSYTLAMLGGFGACALVLRAVAARMSR
jgi:hypothetical protein